MYRGIDRGTRSLTFVKCKPIHKPFCKCALRIHFVGKLWLGNNVVRYMSQLMPSEPYPTLLRFNSLLWTWRKILKFKEAKFIETLKCSWLSAYLSELTRRYSETWKWINAAKKTKQVWYIQPHYISCATLEMVAFPVALNFLHIQSGHSYIML